MFTFGFETRWLRSSQNWTWFQLPYDRPELRNKDKGLTSKTPSKSPPGSRTVTLSLAAICHGPEQSAGQQQVIPSNTVHPV
ncbi:hypothetical protein BDW66DRAFT_126433 [Aspergillus desertorum]